VASSTSRSHPAGSVSSGGAACALKCCTSNLRCLVAMSAEQPHCTNGAVSSVTTNIVRRMPSMRTSVRLS